MSDSLWPHGLQHSRIPCPLPSPRVCPSSCRLYWWCHPTISTFVVPFSFCPQSSPASGSFPVSRLFTSGGQSIRASASASVLPVSIQGWLPLGFTGLILLSKELSRVFSSTAVQKHQFFGSLPSLWYSCHNYMWLLERPYSLDYMDLCWKSDVFNSVQLFIAFLPRSNCLLISWLQSPSAVLLEPKKRKSVTASTFSPSIFHEVKGLDAMILVFLILSFKPAFSLSSLYLIERFFSSSSLSPIRVVSSAYLRFLVLLPVVLIPACNSSVLALLMICFTCKFNKQGDHKQPCHTPISILNQSVVPYRVLTVSSWPKCRFLRRQVRWSGIPISLNYSLLWSTYSKALAKSMKQR